MGGSDSGSSSSNMSTQHSLATWTGSAHQACTVHVYSHPQSITYHLERGSVQRVYAYRFPTKLKADGSGLADFLGYEAGARVTLNLTVIFTPDAYPNPTPLELDLGLALPGALVLHELIYLEGSHTTHEFDLAPN